MRIAARLPARLSARPCCHRRALHSSSTKPANVLPLQALGPPPDPPQKGRFWQHVHVRKVDAAYEIHLDTRPLRNPVTRAVLRLPLSKPHLALALALEWDALPSVQAATRQHLIPLTSLACRALSLATASSATRADTVAELMRFLDTDSLLCWAPPSDPAHAPDGLTLRARQQALARELVAYLSCHTWPAITIEPVLEEGALMPKPQPRGTRDLVQAWLLGLTAWELAAVERATLAGKSLLTAARLVVEWSHGPAGVREDAEAGRRCFGVEQAADAASLEVDWQTRKWGEVEDTHDVEKEDLRRQLGSVVLLVSGTDPSRDDEDPGP